MTSNVEVRGAISPLKGFDSAGEVFVKDGLVLRGIYPGHEAAYRQILSTCQAAGLFQQGIVATTIWRAQAEADLPYALIFEHARVPFITYPHEWTNSMLKDAALFHIALFARLEQHGLTFKDFHPYNILFDGPKPVFVDFASIIPLAELPKQTYLSPPKVPSPFQLVWDQTAVYLYQMYRRMYVPYFQLPLYYLDAGQRERARERQLQTTLNAKRGVIKVDEVLPAKSARRQKYEEGERSKRLALMQPGKRKSAFWRALTAEAEALNVAPPPSGYGSYYANKGVTFDFEPTPSWTQKQQVVYDTIRRFQPRTVLDIGSNTGWFSILAAKLGCQVVALDLDEYCADTLYQYARREGLPVLALVADITKLAPAMEPLDFAGEPSLSRLRAQGPLVSAASERLKCDLTLALAIAHHLVLGRGLSFDEVVALLGGLTERVLVVEFVALEDKLVRDEPQFFPAYTQNPGGFGWYTLDGFVTALRRVFQSVEVTPSPGDGRFLLQCVK